MVSGEPDHGEPQATTEGSREDSGEAEPDAAVRDLTTRYGVLDGAALLRPLIETEFADRLAIVSSFGAESAIVLAHVAEIDRCTPVLFLDTGRLFGETLRYRDRLIRRLRLEDVRTIAPGPDRIAAEDHLSLLWLEDPDRCCAIRKVEPLIGALEGFAAWVSGRKRYHGASRAALPIFETDGAGRIKINPLANWSPDRIAREFLLRDLPRHPLEARGYASIGCATCTARIVPGDDPRAGRWRGRDKSECGIHLSLGLDGRPASGPP